MQIWIDADACPRRIKEFLFKASRRLEVPLTLVANNGQLLPRSPLIRMVVVGREIDAADHHIVEHSAPGDLVVTADIPLAAALIDKGVVALDARGTVFTPDNVKEALATRNLMTELREQGVMEGGPRPQEQMDTTRFANAFDREVTRLRRRRG
jgi:hypothetical protein